MEIPPVILTIAGFDPSSGAGITADLKTIAAHGCYGIAGITSLTVQSTQGVRRMELLATDLVRETLNELSEDFTIAAAKIGMVGSEEMVGVISDFLKDKRFPIVLDCVLKSSSGMPLLDDRGLQALISSLLPMSDVVTPNLMEAEAITAFSVRNIDEMKAAAERLQALGAKNVVIKGGHLSGDMATDLLRTCHGTIEEFTGRHVESKSTHGTGCAFSSAIACNLALGDEVGQAVRKAKRYVYQAMVTASPLGKGAGPIHHLHPFRCVSSGEERVEELGRRT